ncbi:MAG: hypothetical protein K0U37_04685 [Gammaproteobacteria bacterium]|nr:hypothetical protein [Gammaproteobacteria bacterium]
MSFFDKKKQPIAYAGASDDTAKMGTLAVCAAALLIAFIIDPIGALIGVGIGILYSVIKNSIKNDASEDFSFSPA